MTAGREANANATKLSGHIPEPVVSLCQRLAEAGYRAWVVGGSVRDLLLAQGGPARPGDWDLATDARPEQVSRLFKRVIPTGIKHGTVTVMIGKQGFEVTTLRGETSYSDGRHPDHIYFVDDIRADLQRRDFTVNAIAYDPLEDQLIDPFGGLEDLSRRVLRAVGDAAARFGEDGLRVMRAARFVATLDMQLEAETARAIRPSLATYRLVSPERIREEWLKALTAAQPSRALEVMREHGLLEVSLPELQRRTLSEGAAQGADSAPSEAARGAEEQLDSAPDEVPRGAEGAGAPSADAHITWSQLLRALDAAPRDAILRTALLLTAPEPSASSAASEHARAVCARLRFSNAERDRVTHLVASYPVPPLPTRPALRRWLKATGPELLPQLWPLCQHLTEATGRSAEPIRELAERAEAELAAGVPLSARDLAVTGRELMQALDLPPGPLLGKLLEQLLDHALEHPDANQPAALLSRAAELRREA